MSDANLDRVRQDLAVMRQALGYPQGYERDLIGHNLAMAALGVLMIAFTEWTRTPLPIERGSPEHLTYVSWLVLPALTLVAVLLIVSYRRRGFAPQLWRENRLSLVVSAVLVPLYLMFVAWAAWLGVAAGAISIVTFFMFGMFMLGTAIVDRTRRYWAGWGVATMLAGASAPFFSYKTSGILLGLWLISAGMSTVAIVRWGMRREEPIDAGRL